MPYKANEARRHKFPRARYKVTNWPGEAARRACAEGVGRDGHMLLAAVAAPDAPAWLREVPAVMLLRPVWIQNFCLVQAEAGAQRGPNAPGEDGMLVRWRTTVEGFPTSLVMIASPYDPEVHYAKCSTAWTWCARRSPAWSRSATRCWRTRRRTGQAR